jgi:hypothetical protein
MWRCGGALVAMAVAAHLGCAEPCCTYDSQPIGLDRGDKGELLAWVRLDGTTSGKALLDTGSPVSIWNLPLAGAPEVRQHELRLLGITAAAGAPIRAILRDTLAVGAPLSAIVGASKQELTPVALLGGDLLGNFSVEIGFGVPQLVLWQEQKATDGFLS